MCFAKSLLAALVVLILLPSICWGQITVRFENDIDALVRNLFVSEGIQVSNVQFTGDNAGNVRAIGVFDRGPAGPMNIFSKGIILSTGNAESVTGPNRVANDQQVEADASFNFRGMGDVDLQNLVIPPTYDAAVLEFDFEAQSDSVVFRYIFASEEYTEWVDELFNDVFAFFISGPGIIGKQNIALLPDGNPVAVNSVNHIRNSAFYVDNPYFSPARPAPYNIKYDGFTVTLEARVKVEPCKKYRLKIAICDVEDLVLDSAVLLEAYSLKSKVDTARVVGGYLSVPNRPTTWESCNDLRVVYKRKNTQKAENVSIRIGGTARNFVDYRLSNNSLFFPIGVDSAVINISTILDAIPEGTETITLTYRPINACQDHTLTIYIADAEPRLSVFPKQNISWCGLPGDTTFRVRAEVQQNGGQFAYEWRSSSGQVLNRQSDWDLLLTQDTTLIVKVTDKICGLPAMEDTLSFDLLNFDRNNRLEFELSDTIICEGQTASFQPQPKNGTGNYSYLWSTGRTSQTLTMIATQNGTLSLKISDECQESSKTAQINLHTSSLKSIDNLLICKYETISLRPILASSSGWIDFKWLEFPNLNQISDQKDLIGWTAAEEVVLEYKATDGCGKEHTSRFQVSLFPQPSMNLGDTVAVCEGDSWTIEPELAGVGLKDFVWTQISTGEIVSTSRNLTGTSNSNERYRFSMSDTCGILREQNFVIKVTPRNLLVNDITALPNKPVCINTEVKFDVQAKNGSGIFTYRWSNGSQEKSISTIINEARTLSVEVSDGCLAITKSIEMDVFPSPDIELPSDSTLCFGSSIQIIPRVREGGGPFEQIRWFDLNGMQVEQSDTLAITNLRKDTLWVASATDSCGQTVTTQIQIGIFPVLEIDMTSDTSICFGNQITLLPQVIGSGNFNYLWLKMPEGTELSRSSQLILSPNTTTEYLLRVSDRCFDEEMAFQVRVIQPDLNLNEVFINPGLRVCRGTKVNFIAVPTGGSGDYDIVWPDGSINSEWNISVDRDTSVLIRYSDGCQNKDSLFRLQVFSLPEVTVPESLFLCTGEQVQIQGILSGGSGVWNLIEWRSPNQTAIGNEQNLFLTPLIEGIYTLTAIDDCNIQATGSIFISLKPVAFLSAPPDTSICAGNSVQLIVGIVGGTNATQFNWIPPLGLNNPTISTPVAKPNRTTTYYMNAFTDGCTSRPISVTVSVLDKPIFDIPNQYNYCKGRDSVAMLSEFISGNGPFSYQWLPTNGLSNPRSQSPKAAPVSNTNYSLQIIDRNLCISNYSVLINSNELPIFQPIPDNYFCKGDAGIQITLKVINSGNDSFIWNIDPISGVVGKDGDSPWFSPDTTTKYHISSINGRTGCTSDTLSFTVSLFERPRAETGEDQTICVGDTVSIQASVPNMSNRYFKFHWSPTEWIDNPNSSLISAHPSRSINYFVYASDSLCIGPIDSIRIFVNPTPTLALPERGYICKGDTLFVQVVSSGGFLPYNYEWNSNDYVTYDSETDVAKFYPLQSQKIVLSLWGRGCVNPILDSVYIEVQQPQAFGADFEGSGITHRIYRDSHIQLRGWTDADSGYHFKWSPEHSLNNSGILNPVASPRETTTYTLEFNQGTCSGRDSVTIEVVDRVKINLIAKGNIPYSICEGDSLRLFWSSNLPSVSFYPLPNHRWNRTSESSAIVYPIETNEYVFIAIDTLTGERDTAKLLVNVRPKPVAAFDWAIVDPCMTTQVSLLNKSLWAEFYTWNFGDSSATSNEAHPEHEYFNTGKYKVNLIARSNYDCVDSISEFIQVIRYEKMKAEWELLPNSTQVLFLPNTQCKYKIRIHNAKEILWYWGDGYSNSDTMGTHTYSESGIYEPVLIMTDSMGCSQDFPLGKFIIREPVIEVPDAFSPNGDGNNDNWQLYIRSTEAIHVSIFDRFGVRVFESNQHEAIWNGENSSGNPLPEGSYIYRIILGNKEWKGSIQLIR